MKIRSKIIVTFIGIFIIITSIIIGLTVYQVNSILIQKQKEGVSIASNEKAKQVDMYLQSQKEVINLMGASQVFRDFLKGNPSSSDYLTLLENVRERLIRSMGINTSFYEMFLLDTKGIVVISTDPTQEGKSKLTDPYFIEAQKGSYIKDIYFSDTTGKISYALSAPITDDATKKLLGVVVIRVYMDNLLAIIKDTEGLGQTGENFLINHDKLLLTPSRYLGEDKVLTYNVDTKNANDCFEAQEIQEKITKSTQDEDAQEYIDYRGVAIIGAHNYIPGVEWCVISKIDKNELFQPINSIIASLVIISVGGVIVFFIIGLFISQRITNPIEHLSQGVMNITKKGNLDYRVALNTKDEIGELSRNFDQMTAAVRQSRSDIEVKVRNQTQEIVAKEKDLEDQQKAILNILEDVAAEKETATLEKTKFEALLTSIGDGIIATDAQTRIIIMNPAASTMLGWRQEDVYGKKLVDVVAVVDDKGKTVEEPERPIIRAVSELKPFVTSINSHYNYVTRDGKKFPVLLNASPVIVAGKLIGAVNVFRDVTHEKDVDRMKTEFISLASHQLRTPLSAMKWFSEMLLAGDAGMLTDEQKEYIGNISQSNERMIALVNSLLNISRIESGRITIEPEPTDIGSLIRDVVGELRMKLDEKKLTLVTSVHPDLPTIMLDPKLIREVYKNLLTNSIKYTPEGGDITVFASKKGEELVFQVTDTGYGIPQKDKEKVFSKFYRGENITKLETDGTGLGLYLVKSIIDSSGGKIWFESDQDKGTTFWFSLPMGGMKKKEGEVTFNA